MRKMCCYNQYSVTAKDDPGDSDLSDKDECLQTHNNHNDHSNHRDHSDCRGMLTSEDSITMINQDHFQSVIPRYEIE